MSARALQPRRSMRAAWVLALLGTLAGAQDAMAASRAQAAAVQAPAASPASAACAKTWVGHEAEYEAALRAAVFDREEDIPVGVTRPKHVFLKDGGPVRSVAWKPLRPGIHNGFWDSYTSEIAAYEIDRLLQLGMVPPVVQREWEGESGAAVFWVDGVKSWKISQPIVGPDVAAWNRQVVRMKMLDDLIGNPDRNQGNLLYDADYHLILIDHSRAFTRDSKLPVPLAHVDREIWARMDALTEETVKAATERWLDKGQVKSLIARRDRMRAEIAKLVAAKSEAEVFLPPPR